MGEGGGGVSESTVAQPCRIDPVMQVCAPQGKSYHLSRFPRARPAGSLSTLCAV